jgi:hypothetical protein
MLFNWSGAAYRSPQRDVAIVSVLGFWPIEITHHEDGEMHYAYGMENAKTLHETEGFESRDELDDWFRAIVRPGNTVTKRLMRFRLMGVPAEGGCPTFSPNCGTEWCKTNGCFALRSPANTKVSDAEHSED